ncbi:MAG: hypothetical protein WA947_04700 [Phormidesmis sp.]
MKLFSRPKQRPPTLPSDEDLANFEQDFKKTADDFLLVRDRFFAIRRAKAKYEQATAIDPADLPKEELAQLEERIESLKITLESQLLSWREASEPFWQIVRYVGLGLAIGWALGFWVSGKKASADNDSASLQSMPTLLATASPDSPRLLD